MSNSTDKTVEEILSRNIVTYDAGKSLMFSLESTKKELDKAYAELFLELIGENPPESEYWRYNNEGLGQIQLRAELRQRVEERLAPQKGEE